MDADGVAALAQKPGKFFTQLEERHDSFDSQKRRSAVLLSGDMLLGSNLAAMGGRGRTVTGGVY
jgi:hypothetical protein